MKLALALAALLGLSVSAAFAECGHDRTAQTDTPAVASLDATTTASTTVEGATAVEQPETVVPPEAD